MKVLVVLCLAAVALAKPQDYNQQYSSGPVTTVTERTFTVKGDAEADQYSNNYASNYASSGSYGSYGYAAAPVQSAYSYETVASAIPQPSAAYYHQQHQSLQAAPAVAYQAAYQAPTYNYAYQAAPAVAYQAAYQAPTYNYAYQAAPAVAYQAAPAVAYQAAPAIAYQAAPAVAYQGNVASSVGVRSESSFDNYQGVNQAAAGETKVYKHVYAFAAPEEPATRARVSVQAPVSSRKHYKLVFIKAPSQQTVVDSEITLPAQEEEKTLIYVLSKNQKQAQPEIRIKQQEASKHAKPEVFFLKYKTEAEAQAIASGAISGQSSGVPANGEIISDGSVSILGKNTDYAYRGLSGSGSSGFASNAGFANNAGISGVSQYSVGAVGVSTPTPVVAYKSASSNYGRYSGAGSAGLSGGFSSAYTQYNNYQQEPASVAIKVTSEPSYVSSTASSLQL